MESTLLDVVERLPELNCEQTIYAVEPWQENAEAYVGNEPEEGGIPAEAHGRSMKYFIEVAIALNFLEDWIASIGRQPSLSEKCERLISYAVNDA